jgi:hypothetical protein
LQAATARKIKDEEIALRTALFFKGRPVKPVDEVPALRALPKITSYFTLASNNVLDLPEETLPNITIDEPVVFQESASLLNRENIGKFIEYMLGRRERSSHFNPLVLRHAIQHYLVLNDNNVKQTARLITSLAISAGSRETESVLQERWISSIKYYRKSRIEDVDLESFLSHFLEHGDVSFKCQSVAHRTRVGNPGGVKPVWGQLEIQLTDYIVTMRAQRKAVNRIVVLHRALELVPNFMGGLLDPDFSNRAIRWY